MPLRAQTNRGAAAAEGGYMSLPTSVSPEEHDLALAEVRWRRLQLQAIVAHVDFIGVALTHGFLSPAGARSELSGIFDGPDVEEGEACPG